MRGGNCVHLFSDSVAAITRRRPAPFSGSDVSSLMFTTLLPYTPQVLINAEVDDSGDIEVASCDCVYSRLGMTRAIHNVASYGKLTGHGVTLVGTPIVKILEQVLPGVFGGQPGDYQLVEEDTGSQTSIVLRISPRTGVRDTKRIQVVFLDHLRRQYGGSLAARLWLHAGAIECQLAEPLRTSTGKVLPLHLLDSKKVPIHEA
jgi:hypothetical protein